jgi:hypothetical protein
MSEMRERGYRELGSIMLEEGVQWACGQEGSKEGQKAGASEVEMWRETMASVRSAFWSAKWLLSAQTAEQKVGHWVD